jgi:hypothetical protein
MFLANGQVAFINITIIITTTAITDHPTKLSFPCSFLAWAMLFAVWVGVTPLWQNRHLVASALIISAQCGHFLVLGIVLAAADPDAVLPHTEQRQPPILTEIPTQTINQSPAVIIVSNKWRMWFVPGLETTTLLLQYLQNPDVFSSAAIFASPIVLRFFCNHDVDSVNQPMASVDLCTKDGFDVAVGSFRCEGMCFYF